MSDNGAHRILGPQSEEHKQNVARSKIVKAYLEALSGKSAARRKEEREARIAEITELLTTGANDSIERLMLVQERLELTGQTDVSVPVGLQQQFIDVAAAFSQTNGISVAAWRELGVPALILRHAGLTGGTAQPLMAAYVDNPARHSGGRNPGVPKSQDQAFLRRLARLYVEHGSGEKVAAELGIHSTTAGQLKKRVIEAGWIEQTPGWDGSGPFKAKSYRALIDLSDPDHATNDHNQERQMS